MTLTRQALLAGLGLLLTACGGSGSSQMPSSAPSGTSVTIAGKVSGTSTAPSFNGLALATGGATLTANSGSPATAAQIQPGIVLRGTASRTSQGLQLVSAELHEELEGNITSVDLAGSAFVVLGKRVVVDALTRIVAEGSGTSPANLTLADLRVGDLVEVYGSAKADGSVLATRVERQSAEAPESDVFHGTVLALDVTAKTFQAAGFLVSYGTATVLGTLSNGARVEVQGTASGSAFLATRVRVETDLGGSGSELELSGPISGLDTTAKTFMLMSYKVDYSAAEIEGTLVEGADVEAEGTAGPSGTSTLLAREVSVRFAHAGSGESDLEREGLVTAVDPVAGTISLGGATYWTDAATLFVKGDAPATITDVKVGVMVEVHVLSTRMNAAGQAYATLVSIGGS